MIMLCSMLIFRSVIELGAHLDPSWVKIRIMNWPVMTTEKQFDGHRGRLLTWHFIKKNVEG